MSTKLLFVCTGNICRSPMADGIARLVGQQRGLDLEVQSASAMGLEGNPADPKAVAVCRELGIDLSDHRAQPITPALMAWADHVLVMELRHAAHLRDAYPDHDAKIALLGPFGGLMEIADPLGGWKFTFRRIRDQISACVEGFIGRLG